MSSKSAIKAVLQHKQPEYIPFGSYVIDCDTVERVLGRPTYVRNKIQIQLALWDGRRDEVAQSLKEDSVELYRRLPSIDIIVPFTECKILPPSDYEPEKVKKLDDRTWETASGAVWRIAEQTNDIVCVKTPPFQLPSIDDFARPLPVTPPDRSCFEAYDALVNAFKGDRYIAGISGGFHPLVLLGGMVEGLMLLCEQPELVEAATARYTEQQNALDEFYIRPDLDGIFVEQDLATTNATFCSPAMLRRFALPGMKERVANLRRRYDEVIMHCCGNARAFIPMMIEAGICCYQSLQTGAGMDIEGLKREFGSDMAFWGGVAVETLITGTPDDVRANVRDVMTRCSRDGGFILGPSHSVAYGVPYDNFMAMLDEHDKLKYNV